MIKLTICTRVNEQRLAKLAVAVLLILAGALAAPMNAAAQTPADIPEDMEAGLFMQKCFNCHQGLLTGRELVNTHQRTREGLEDTVHRMQQYAGPLSEEQITQLVDLMKDEEFVFRIEEAKLLQEEQAEAEAAKLAEQGTEADEFALLYMQSCAMCHNFGLGNATGIDLVHTLNMDTAQLRANVVRMQQQAGPLTDEQIDGLTALLKDENRMDRLVAAGHAAPAGTTPPSGETGSSQPSAHQVTEPATAEAQAGHAESNFPTGLIIGLIIFTIITAIGCYFFVWRDEE